MVIVVRNHIFRIWLLDSWAAVILVTYNKSRIPLSDRHLHSSYWIRREIEEFTTQFYLSLFIFVTGFIVVTYQWHDNRSIVIITHDGWHALWMRIWWSTSDGSIPDHQSISHGCHRANDGWLIWADTDASDGGFKTHFIKLLLMRELSG
jgi:hypothetical protein